ncbi:ketosynthase chain-length factor [Amycolatopsis keratiniphila]|uniref:Ketosynthase chain-length factor n=2 Tax=Amycolatopsis keratiniphila subsp. keratiniphila TaxID=227715 RepID=A0A1W2M2Z3_9PSEU|nr:ketosynthase chain-length factor [Amycolatopsis keratiniphila]ONF74381.1 ketosynthase chain-length factor [Amycolatopsis keratiniphila subsp. keratiniphila]
MNTSVVITGIGIVSPLGNTLKTFTEATYLGVPAIQPIEHFDTSGFSSSLAGQVLGFSADEHLNGRMLAQTDRVTRFALMASDQVIADTGLDLSELDEHAVGVVTSNATGGFDYTHREMQKLWTRGPDSVSVYQAFAWFYAVNTGQISIRHKLKGPSGVVVSDQSGGLDAVAHGRRTVRQGATASIVGGVESSFDPWGWTSHCASGRLSQALRPENGYLPFDERANGYVPCEGGALLMLEAEETAKARSNYQPYARVAGHGATFDSSEGHTGLRRAAETALTDAGRTPADIDLVLADAAGLPWLDEHEATAIRELFGPNGVPVSAPKTMIGRALAGAGAIDVVWAVLAIQENLIPPTIYVTAIPEDYQIDLVTRAPRVAEVNTVLILARGHGGFNSALVVERPHLENVSIARSTT